MEDKGIYVYELQKENQQLKEEIEKLKNEIISVVLDEKHWITEAKYGIWQFG